MNGRLNLPRTALGLALASAAAFGCGGSGSTAGQGSGSGAGTPGSLNPKVAPGGNFDLSLWQLEEPIGLPKAPTTIDPSRLKGASGFQDAYFFTDPVDGAMTFFDPENGVTTPNSNYPRSELREMNADGSPANWPIAGTNRLSASLKVTQVPDHVCVGQIHVGTPLQAGLSTSTKPLLELYYYANGDIKLGIEDSPAGGQTSHPIANVPLGTRFDYTIQLTGDGTITLLLNGAPSTFQLPAGFTGYGQYFKAGNYDQSVGTDPTIAATVKFYALSLSHLP
jgi:hypothetical protein